MSKHIYAQIASLHGKILAPPLPEGDPYATPLRVVTPKPNMNEIKLMVTIRTLTDTETCSSIGCHKSDLSSSHKFAPGAQPQFSVLAMECLFYPQE